MGCALFVLLLAALLVLAGLGALVWFGWRRVSVHVKDNPEAAKIVAEVIALLLTAPKPKAEKAEGEIA
jgi:predicted negative regulator of RcsB-dependent stress response